MVFINEALSQKNSDSFISKEDLKHIQIIEHNLTPVFILKGATYEKTIPQMMKEDNVPGLSIAFVDNGKIAWTKCYGYANLEDSIKVTPETVFLSASLSKPVTAMAALHMVEKKILNLDEDVNITLKGWKIPVTENTLNQKVTLRRLIGHTAGVMEKDKVFIGYDTSEAVPTVEQILKGEEPSKDSAVYIEFEPGTRRTYSNAGYLVIQELMTDVTGKSFPDLIDEIVLKPSMMLQSSFEQPIPQSLMTQKAVGYSSAGEAMEYNIYPFMAPAALWTTPSDLGRFMMTLLNDFEGKSSVILTGNMMKQVLDKRDERLGFSKIYWGNDVLFRHTGSNDGFNSYMVGSANKKQALIIMTNSENGFTLIDAIQRAVAKEYQWEYLKPEELKKQEILISTLRQYSGQYKIGATTFEFEVQNNELYVRIKEINDKFLETIPVGEHAFLLASKPLKFVFQKGIHSEMEKLHITDNKADISIAVRIK